MLVKRLFQLSHGAATKVVGAALPGQVPGRTSMGAGLHGCRQVAPMRLSWSDDGAGARSHGCALRDAWVRPAADRPRSARALPTIARPGQLTPAATQAD